MGALRHRAIYRIAGLFASHRRLIFSLMMGDAFCHAAKREKKPMQPGARHYRRYAAGFLAADIFSRGLDDDEGAADVSLHSL